MILRWREEDMEQRNLENARALWLRRGQRCTVAISIRPSFVGNSFLVREDVLSCEGLAGFRVQGFRLCLRFGDIGATRI